MPEITTMHGWELIRAAAAEDGAAAAVLTNGYNYNEQRANCINLYDLFGEKFGGIVLAFFGDTVGLNAVADGDTFGLDLIGYREISGSKSKITSYNPPLLICSLAAAAGVIGTMECTPDGGTTTTAKWCDSMTLTNKNKLFSPARFDHDNNRICQLAFDAAGIKWIYPRIHTTDGAVGGEAPGIGIVATSF